MARLASERSFFRNVVTMMGGTAVAQAIPILVSPILTRMYSPQEYGGFAAFLAISTVACVFATLRLEPAVVLPRDDTEASSLVLLCLCVAGCVSTILLAVALIFGDEILVAIPALPGHWAVLLVVPMVFGLAAFQAFSFWLSRRGAFAPLAQGAGVLQVVTAASSLAIGASGSVPGGLIFGRLVGQLLSAGWVAKTAVPDWAGYIRATAFRGFKGLLSKYRQFPLFNLPYSLIGTASREMLIFAFTFYQMPQTAGHYALARSVLYAPVGFLSASLSQVFYREAATSLGTPRLARLVESLMSTIIWIFTPAFVALVLWGPEVFELIFGTQWRTAGEMASTFAPAAFLFLFSSWPERLFEVTANQHRSLVVQVIFDLIAAITVLWVLGQDVSPIGVVAAYTTISCLYHCTYLIVAFRSSNLPVRILVRGMFITASIALAALACYAVMREIFGQNALWIAVPLTAIYSFTVAVLQFRRLASVS